LDRLEGFERLEPKGFFMQPILRDFLDKWVYPTGFTGSGVEFRLRQTERCLPLWDRLVTQAIAFAEKDLKSGSDEYKAVRARAGYAAEGRSCR